MFTYVLEVKTIYWERNKVMYENIYSKNIDRMLLNFYCSSIFFLLFYNCEIISKHFS